MFEDWNNYVITGRNKQLIKNFFICSRIFNSHLFNNLYSIYIIMLSPDIEELRLNYTSNFPEKLNSTNKKMLFKMKFPFSTL